LKRYGIIYKVQIIRTISIRYLSYNSALSALLLHFLGKSFLIFFQGNTSSLILIFTAQTDATLVAKTSLKGTFLFLLKNIDVYFHLEIILCTRNNVNHEGFFDKIFEGNFFNSTCPGTIDNYLIMKECKIFRCEFLHR